MCTQTSQPTQALQIDFAKALQVLELIELLHFEDAIDRTDFQTRLAAGAIIGVDDRELFGDFFTGTGFGHYYLDNAAVKRAD